MLHEKPAGPMHEALRRALDELKTHNNPYGCITYVTNVLTNSERPPLPSGVDYAAHPDVDSANSKGGNGSTNNGGGLATTGSWMGAASVGAIEFQGATGVIRSPEPAHRQGARGGGSSGGAGHGTTPTSGSSLEVVLSQTANNTSAPTDGAGLLVPGSQSAAATESVAHYKFNATEVVRLLLIRAEAFGVTKQHEKALIDAKNALEMSRGQSPEAYFCVGREHRRLFHISDSVDAFDMGEALLRSIQQTLRADTREAFDAGVKEATSDEDFWAQRGYSAAEVQSLGISRGEFELQEQASIQRQGAVTSRLPTGSLLVPGSPGAMRQVYTAEDRDSFGGGGAVTDSGNESPLPSGAGGVSGGGGGAAATSSNASWASPSAGAAGGINANLLEDLLFLRTGISAGELAMWRRLSNEAHALLAMRSSHTVPVAVHQTSLTMLDRTLNGIRGGLTLSVDNGTGSTLRFVGAAAPDAQYIKNFSFPETIPKGHCGMAMVQPRGWGGFSGCVCYELVDATYPVCLMMCFENPMMGSVKFGVRFLENAFPSDLRKAFADLNGGSNQGIQGAAPSTHTPNTTATEKGAAPATAAIRGASRANAVKAVRMPPNSMWMPTHRATFGRRSVKVTSYAASQQTICASLSEMQRTKMRSIELLGAFEYAGAQTLKKMSCVNRRYRELVNNLPPPMFFGAGRKAYPDYTLVSDRDGSPWVIRGKEITTWRIVFEGRVLDREELSVVCDIDGQTTSRPILTISVETHARVASQFYYGDKRSPQLTLKESWVPFSSNMFLATPMGRTFGTCNNDSQGQFTLAVGGPNPSKTDEPLYTARKKTSDGARGTPATNVVPSGGAYVDPYLAGSNSASALNGISSSSVGGQSSQGNSVGAAGGTKRGGGGGGGGVGGGLSVSPLAFMADKGNGSMMLQSQRAATANPPTPSRAAIAGVGGSSASLSSLNSAAAGTKTGGRAGNPLAHLARGDHYTLWRSQHVSGASIPNTPARHTNQGAQIVAEVRVAPQGMHALTRGYTLAEVRLLPGADALLATVMTFCIARW